MRYILSSFHRPLSFVARALGDRSGATAIMLALGLSVIVAFARLGTEAAMWYMTQRTMQTAADSAASAAAANLATATLAGTTPTSAQLIANARSVAANYSFVDGTGGTHVYVCRQPLANSCTSNSNDNSSSYVTVAITQQQTAMLSSVVSLLPNGAAWTAPIIGASAKAKANTQV